MHLGMLIMAVYNERRTTMKHNEISELRMRSIAINATQDAKKAEYEAKLAEELKLKKAARIAATPLNERVEICARLGVKLVKKTEEMKRAEAFASVKEATKSPNKGFNTLAVALERAKAAKEDIILD